MTADQARAELARRELARRNASGVPAQSNMSQTISSIARPLLEMGGAVGGGALGMAAPVPGGTAIGGGLGFAGGKSAADLLDRYMGTKPPLQNAGEALTESGENIAQGAGNELGGAAVGAALGPLKNSAGKLMGNLGRIQSGVDERQGQRLFNDPGAFFSSTLKSAGEKLGAIRDSLGINTRRFSIDNALDAESGAARNFVKDAYTQMQAGKQLPLADIVKASQSMDDIIEATPMRQRAKRAELFDLKRDFTDQLNTLVPEERAAAKDYSRSAIASNFRKFLPVTKNGDVSVSRTLGLGLLEGGGGLASAIPTTIAQSPIIGGLGITAAGAGYKAAESPMIRRGVAAALRAYRDRNTAQ